MVKIKLKNCDSTLILGVRSVIRFALASYFRNLQHQHTKIKFNILGTTFLELYYLAIFYKHCMVYEKVYNAFSPATNMQFSQPERYEMVPEHTTYIKI
jgi:hypothetical protein